MSKLSDPFELFNFFLSIAYRFERVEVPVRGIKFFFFMIVYRIERVEVTLRIFQFNFLDRLSYRASWGAWSTFLIFCSLDRLSYLANRYSRFKNLIFFSQSIIVSSELRCPFELFNFFYVDRISYRASWGARSTFVI